MYDISDTSQLKLKTAFFQEDKIIELSKYNNVTICVFLSFGVICTRGGIRLKEYLDFYRKSVLAQTVVK